MPGNQASGAPAAGRSDVESLVREFYDEKAKALEAVAPDRASRSTRLQIAVIVSCLVIGSAVTLGRASARHPAGERLEQGARATMYLASLSVREFRTANGRLPRTLAEAKVEETGLGYARTSDSTFELTMLIGGKSLLYNSVLTDATAFLGPNASLLGVR